MSATEGSDDMDDETGTMRISATGRVPASAADVFAVVASPDGHVAVDGSGMLLSAPDARPLVAVGQKFTMSMDREPLGDIPLGKYTVHNAVTQLVPDRLVEWNIGLNEGEPLGHVYGWELEPVSETETLVTNYCDWTNLDERLREHVTFPIVPRSMLEASVERLRKHMAEHEGA
jgi:hypothetical protein